VPNGINGVSFQSLLRGSKFRSKRAYLYWEFHERGFDQALRQGKWKVVRRGRNGSRLELYDLQADPSESYDLAVQFPKIAAEMEALLSKARVPSADYPVKTD
jgi:arylsulfatase A-like enzyme